MKSSLPVVVGLLLVAVVLVVVRPRIGPPASPGDRAGVAPATTAVSLTHAAEAGNAPDGARARRVEVPAASDLATPIAADFLARAAAGFELPVGLPDGSVLALQVTGRRDAPDGTPSMVEGTLAHPAPGRFIFYRQPADTLPGPMAGTIFFPSLDYGYRVESPNGRPLLVRRPVDAVACVEYAPPADAEPEEIPADHPNDIPIPPYQGGVIPLQSLPGATGVLYLDYDGEDGPHAGWGDFDAEKHNVSNAGIQAVWERVAEDFAPFNFNVTTDLAVYLAAPATSRQRCIVTKTTTAAPGAGGVAYVGSFNWDGDTPCWAFYGSGKNAAEVISHELGHTLSLSHDGRTTPAEGYYGGHGTGDTAWAPIMGVGYSRNLSQWSKGEYLNANQTQDDLDRIIVNNNSGAYRTDDHGGDHVGASWLDFALSGVVDDEGVIEESSDTDALRFTVQTAGSLNLTVSPVGAGPNLDVLAELYDSGGALLDTANPADELDATLTTAVSPGEYTVRISGTGKGDPLLSGYTDYASLGYYSLSGTIPDPVLPDQFDIAENSPFGASVGTVAARGAHGANPLTWAISSGNYFGAFAVEPSTGSLTVANAAIMDAESLSDGWHDPPRIDLEVAITDTVNPALNELIRVQVTVLDVNEAPAVAGTSLTILEHTVVGRALHDMGGADPDQFDVLTYAITGGDPAGRFAVDADGVLLVAADLAFADQSSYSLTVTATDSGSPGLLASATVNVTLIDTVEGYSPGSVVHAFYRGISGNSISNLISAPDYPKCPDDIDTRPEIHANGDGDNYGRVVRSFLIPPITGNYTFWVAGDDGCELRMSINENPAFASTIALFSGYTDYQEWTKFGSQKSASIALVAGQAYYLEARQKEGGGGDHLSLAWEAKDNSNNLLLAQEPIPGLFMAPADFNYCPRLTSAAATVRDDALPGTLLHDFAATDLNPGDTLTYEILLGNGGGTFAIDSATGALTVADPSGLGASHNLTVEVTDNGVPAASGNAALSVTVIPGSTVSATEPLMEFWDGLSGDNLSTLTSQPDFPDRPHRLSELTNFDSGENLGNSYGARIRGYVTPATTGTYTFYLASDDQGELLLSTDSDPANVSQLAFITGWTGYLQWDKFPSQQTSAPVALTAGQPYFIEARIKEGGGGDHLEVGWTGPGVATITVLDSSVIAPYDSNVAPDLAPANAIFDLAANPAAGTAVATYTAVDSPFETVTFAILDGNDDGAFGIDPQSGAVTVADEAALHAGPYYLLIAAQDSGHGGYFPLRTTTTIATVYLGDSDHDQLPDSWELAEIGNLASGGADDPDLDGASNRAEFVFGSKPTDGTSLPEAPRPNGVKTPTSYEFTYRIRNDLPPGAYLLFHSDDMVVWPLLGASDYNITSSTPLDATYNQIVVEVLRSGPKCFLKAGVTP